MTSLQKSQSDMMRYYRIIDDPVKFALVWCAIHLQENWTMQ